MARFYTALARGIREVDSRTINEERDGAPRDVITLPAVKTPNVILLGVSSHKQASESTMRHYVDMIGHHDHRILKGSGGAIADLRVRPDHVRSDDPDNWSRIMVFPVEGTPPTGIGATGCHADETPTQELWTQMRVRVDAGQELFLCITHTPEQARLWQWLKDDYEHPDPWKIEYVLSVFDNQALSASAKKKLKERAARDPYENARLYGAYVNVKGTNPWHPQMKLLQRWLDNCRDSESVERLMLPVEVETETGLKIEDGFGELHIWEPPIVGERYYVIGDASWGYDESVGHDPCGAHIIRRGFRSERPGQVGRFNGYCGGYALGHLMAIVAERYNDALADPDVTGGYGQSTLRGLSDYRSEKYRDGYPHINRDRKMDTQGRPYSKRLGTLVTAGIKDDFIESLRQAMILDAIDFPSAATVRCFMEARLDEKGRLLKDGKLHYEDVHCGGRAAMLLLDRNQTETGSKRERTIEDAFREQGIKGPIYPRRQRGTRPRFKWART